MNKSLISCEMFFIVFLQSDVQYFNQQTNFTEKE